MSEAYWVGCKHVAVRRDKVRAEPFIELKHKDATLYLMRSEMGGASEASAGRV